MGKLYLGVDLHKRSCWVTVLEADGHVLASRKLGTEKWELLEFLVRWRSRRRWRWKRRSTGTTF